MLSPLYDTHLLRNYSLRKGSRGGGRHFPCPASLCAKLSSRIISIGDPWSTNKSGILSVISHSSLSREAYEIPTLEIYWMFDSNSPIHLLYIAGTKTYLKFQGLTPFSPSTQHPKKAGIPSFLLHHPNTSSQTFMQMLQVNPACR